MLRFNQCVTGLTLGSLFDGSGGVPLGGILAGITPLWAAEIEPFPIAVTTKNIPQMKHYGDVSKMNGAEVEPVDIITFGSPCQDMSIAGKRNGLDGSRSGLFFEAVRIITEMRCATDGRFPRFIVWENVPGAFSSNKGEDFRTVLESLCKIKHERLAIPSCKRWSRAGEVVGDDFSLAWRVLDSQFWGVPQRRKRIFLVSDLDGRCAGKILFESESVSGHSAEGFRAWQNSAACAESCSGTSGSICLNDQGGGCINVSENVAGTLRAEAHGHPPCVLLFENHSQDTRFNGPLETAPTVSSTYGMGGNNQPFVCVPDMTYSIQGSMIGRAPNSGPRGSGISENISFTLNTSDRHVVAFPRETLIYSTSKMSHHTSALNNIANALVASYYKDPPTVNSPYYTVRRLTPTECARLQGFPDWWCSGLGIAEPTEKEMKFWTEVFATYAGVTGTRQRSENQIRKWLADPHSDSAEYTMWGNGVSLPCVYFVLSGIAYFSDKEDDNG